MTSSLPPETLGPRIQPTPEQMAEVDSPTIADLSRECAKARAKGDLHRAYCMRVAIIARVLRAQRSAFPARRRRA